MSENEITEIVGNPDEYYVEEECSYNGTDYLHIKIYLIGVFGTALALLNIFFNSFYTLVFVKNRSLRSSPLYYFGIIAILDVIIAVNYILLMSVPVYFDQFGLLWLYHLFLTYFVPVMTISNATMFGSMLLIMMVSAERLLRTFQSEKLAVFRKLMERNRPQICLICICFSFLYKLCTYFELAHTENPNCTDWSRFDVIATPLAMHPDYRFWWMFVARNLFDRIIPFFILVLMNAMIIQTLKKCSIDVNAKDVNNKMILRDATRALLALVSLYLMGQTLQVFITVWEALNKSALEAEFAELYSYINDIMTLMVLISSTLRFPVYCSCNREIFEATKATVRECKTCLAVAHGKKADYLPIAITDASTKTSVYTPQADKVSFDQDAKPEDSTTTWML
uniref:G-protein coupled receptors family 1 profile domain-containing protein n=1 Tax=Panagrolaimus sp. JU765 TaxID=591449 RepID=A0AC34QJG4_9BILA